MQLGLEEILSVLPHRPPMLLVDRVDGVVPGQQIHASRTLSPDEIFFCGHFPFSPVFPGVLIIEALAQTAGVLAAYSLQGQDADGRLPCLMSVKHAQFRAPVFPGDRLNMVVEVAHAREDAWRFSGRASVKDRRVADVSFIATLLRFADAARLGVVR